MTFSLSLPLDSGLQKLLVTVVVFMQLTSSFARRRSPVKKSSRSIWKPSGDMSRNERSYENYKILQGTNKNCKNRYRNINEVEGGP